MWLFYLFWGCHKSMQVYSNHFYPTAKTEGARSGLLPCATICYEFMDCPMKFLNVVLDPNQIYWDWEIIFWFLQCFFSFLSQWWHRIIGMAMSNCALFFTKFGTRIVAARCQVWHIFRRKQNLHCVACVAYVQHIFGDRGIIHIYNYIYTCFYHLYLFIICILVYHLVYYS